jgi:hypothetical protein
MIQKEVMNIHLSKMNLMIVLQIMRGLTKGLQILCTHV